MTDQHGAFVVLGGSGGIGSAVCRGLASREWPVVVASRNAEAVDAVASDIGADAYAVDATDVDAVVACVEEVKAKYGAVAGIANCVGSVILKPAHLTRDEEWQQTMAVNVTSAFAAVKAGAKTMRETGGSIVLVSTAATQIGLPNHEAVAAAKGAVNGLMLSAAATYAGWKIRVNAVAPGLTRTRQTARITENEKSAAASIAMHALGRFGEPGDVASAIIWLLDPANSWVTGQVLGVDGGLGSIRIR